MKIACLHTIESNAVLFEAARPAGVDVSHSVRADLLGNAEKAGGMTPAIEAETVALLLGLSETADAVLLTCSTIGPAAGVARLRTEVPILRADASLAEASVAKGGRVLVLCAVETTVEPSRRLFESAAGATGASIEMRLVPDAWAAFRRGDVAEYSRLVADYADAAFRSGSEVIALAQASMSGAVALAREGHLLASPEISMAAAVAATRRAV
jgi:hypothetical protein